MLISLRLPPGSFSALLCPALCPRRLIFLDGIPWVLGFLVRFGEQKVLAENGSVEGGCEQAFLLLFLSCFVFLSVFSSVTDSSSGLDSHSTLYFSSFFRPRGDTLVSLAGHVTLHTFAISLVIKKFLQNPSWVCLLALPNHDGHRDHSFSLPMLFWIWGNLNQFINLLKKYLLSTTMT